MQPLGGISTLGTTYTDAQVVTQLLIGASERYRILRLDQSGNMIEDASQYVQFDPNPPVITHQSGQAVKRTLTFTARGDWTPNWLRDLIRVRYMLLMPDGGFREWDIGTFTMELPASSITPARSYRTVKAYDLTQILADNKFSQGYAVQMSAPGVGAVQSLVTSGSTSFPLTTNIPDIGRAMGGTLGWAAGDSYLAAVNQVLDSMTYQSIAADEKGVLTSQPFPDYNLVVPSYTFDTTQGSSLVKSPINATIDMSQAINACRVVADDPRTANPAFTAYVENNDPSSLVSIPNWHRKMLYVRDSKLVDQASVTARAVLEVQKGAWVYRAIPLSTIPWPFGQDRDVYGLTYKTTDEGSVSGNFLELGWTHTCKTGTPTVHQWRQLIPAAVA